MKLKPFLFHSQPYASPRSIRIHGRIIAVEEGGLSESAAGGRYGIPEPTARA